MTPEELLAGWDEGQAWAPVARPVALLSRAGFGWDEAADLPLGRRDALLLDLRIATFGPQADCVGACPECGTPVEYQLDLRELRLDPPEAAVGSVEWDGAALRVRPPTTRDLWAAGDDEGVAERLLARCTEPGTVPVEALDAVAAEMERLDPQAVVEIELRCGPCGARWPVQLDVGVLLWDEVEREARSLLGEVDAIARAYGWSEPEILALSARRRRAYVALAEAR